MRSAAAIEAWLAELTDAKLDAVLVDWQVPSDVASLAAAAKAMTAPDAIESMLARTTAADLVALRNGEGSPTLRMRGLEPCDELRSRIPGGITVAAPAQQAADAAPAVDAATMAVMRLSGAVGSVADRPVRLSGRGLPLAAELRFRSTELGVEHDDWERIIAAAGHYRFIAKLDRELCVTDLGLAWLDLDPHERWQQLRDRFYADLTLSERAFLDAGAATVEAALPLADSVTLQRFAAVLQRATVLGLALDGRSSGVTAEQIESHIPAPIDYVYLQPDQTLVAPGPLHRESAAQLAEMAVSEARGVASTWRLTPASLHAAMAKGRTADELLARLERLSSTGVPQPVEYLVRDAERRFGSITVAAGTPTVVRTDHETAKRLLVDRALASLELRVPTGRGIDEGVLHTSQPADAVLEQLATERYPALLIDAAGKPIVPERRVVAVADSSPLSSLTERLLGRGIDVAAMQPDWLHEQLVSAAKSKTPVRVTVASGTRVDHATLVPLAVSNGRLRGRDIERDLERTLPLRAITEVAGLRTA